MAMKNVNFSIGTAITGHPGMMQSKDHEYLADKEVIKDGANTTQTVIFSDQREEATLVYFPTDGATGNSASLAPVTPGTVITLTDAQDTSMAAATWIADSPFTTAVTNNGATKNTVKLMKFGFTP